MTDAHEPTYQSRSEPSSSTYRRQLWDAAFGLQAVDGLVPSTYMRHLADDNVRGEISLDGVGEALNNYYRRQDKHPSVHVGEEEADRVSHRIVELLEEGGFALDPDMLRVIHARLFVGIDDELYAPGSYKSEQLIKCERVLNGDSVLYGIPSLYERSLAMLFAREMSHAYAGYADGATLSHSDTEELARFVANMWMVHPFREGNTRSVAVFLELYLRSMGFDVDNALFERHAVFFRDALVRATYQNRPIGVTLDASHLIQFISKLVEGDEISLDYEALWCIPLFEHPERVRNVSLADAKPMQGQLMREGVTERLLAGRGASTE